MARNHHFSFKQFTVQQELSAMKVCTDACVFGAWVDVDGAVGILDIGTGTGLLSLMVAQRNTEANVCGVEVDEGAYYQTIRNFEASPFSERLKVIHTRIQDFSPAATYDCIVSNPPFYQNDLRSPDRKNNLAHHAETLNFRDLLFSVDRLLSPFGTFHVLLPVAESRVYEQLATVEDWILERQLTLIHKPGDRAFRRMMSFKRMNELTLGAIIPVSEDLYIYDQKGVSYSQEFKDYLKVFYLGF